MRLFFYYALHAFINQLKKLFKTWILIFILACMVIGGAIGAGIGALESAVETQEEEEAPEEEQPEEEIVVPSSAEIMEQVESEGGISVGDIVEAIAGVVILAILVFEIFSADRNGSKIFLPADVPLLFASPMKPQSVLMFRLMTQMGTAIIASIYLVFQLPNLILNAGLSWWASLCVIGAWILTILSGRLIQVLLYTVTSTRPGWKPYIRRILYGILIAAAVGLIIFIQAGGYLSDGLLGIAKGCVRYFNAPWTRAIPFLGWIKGFVRMAVDNNNLWLYIFLGLSLAGMGVLIYVIWHVKADFYEDAMAKSEETAELLARAQSQEGGLYVARRRKKDRSDDLMRDGMSRGSGANVFFFKAVYNRMRFAHLKIFTKTAETYLAVAVAVALITRFLGESTTLIPVALSLAGASFFRALGNPLSQDTQMSYFNLIPEKTYKKLFFSLMGGSYNCAIDVLIAMMVAVLILGADPAQAFLWVLVIVSVDCYATIIGTFIDLSVPVHAGKTIKQLAQIMFIYFGLIPDVIVVVVALVLLDAPLIAALGTVVINLGFAGIFFFLSVLAIDHCFGK